MAAADSLVVLLLGGCLLLGLALASLAAAGTGCEFGTRAAAS